MAACVSGVALDGLEAYSHAWLLFEFHGNTDHGFRSAKVAPPRGYGAKVGWLATRSPHRATPLDTTSTSVSVPAPNTHMCDVPAPYVSAVPAKWSPTSVSRCASTKSTLLVSLGGHGFAKSRSKYSDSEEQVRRKSIASTFTFVRLRVRLRIG